MKVIMRTDSIPREREEIIVRQIGRALKAGFEVKEILDTKSDDGTRYKTLILKGSRLACIRYWGTDIMTGDCEISAIPGVLKCMFG